MIYDWNVAGHFGMVVIHPQLLYASDIINRGGNGAWIERESY
jgi:hypothetical protein